MDDATKIKYSKLLDIYDSIVKESGKYAPYLSKQYFITNTIHQAVHEKGIKQVSRDVVYKALKWRAVNCQQCQDIKFLEE